MDHSAERLLLNGIWEFAAGADGDPPQEGWQPVRVPHRSREFEQDPPSSGWYRTSLRVPEHWDGGGLYLDMGRVRHYGRAYLDGEVIGEHYHMRLPWQLDLSRRLSPGSESVLMVYTHNCSGSYAHAEVDDLRDEFEKEENFEGLKEDCKEDVADMNEGQEDERLSGGRILE